MDTKDFLFSYQPIAYKVFYNAIKNDKLSHAYLISGTSSMPLKEIAFFITKSLLCEHRDPFACENCVTCNRIENNEYADLMYINGKDENIKKSQIQDIISNFEKTPLELNDTRIYVVHLVENMTTVAVNSILKFLEEPGKKVYAILTTENENKILPTIISRTQVVRLQHVDKNIIVDNAKKIGVKQEDSEILSFLYCNEEKIKEISKSKEYIESLKLVLLFIDSIFKGKEEFLFNVQSKITPKLKNRVSLVSFFSLLTIFFKESFNKSRNKEIILKSYDKILYDLYNHLIKMELCLSTIMDTSTKINLNINNGLLIDHISYIISKEIK